MFADIKTAIENINAQTKWLQEELGPISGNLEQLEISTATDLFMLMRMLKEAGEEVAKIANILAPEVAKQVRKCIEGTGMESVDKEFEGEVYRMAPDIKHKVSCNNENKPLLVAWLKSHPRGCEYVKEDIHAKSLESFVINELQAGHEMPGITPSGQKLIAIYQEETLSVRKLPKPKRK